MNAADARLERNPETQALLADAEDQEPVVMDVDATGTTEPELSWSDRMAQQVRTLDATAQAKQAVQAAAEAKTDDEVDPDEMNVVPNRKAQRDAANLRGSIRLNRSRVRRRIHRVLVKRGYWQ